MDVGQHIKAAGEGVLATVKVCMMSLVALHSRDCYTAVIEYFS